MVSLRNHFYTFMILHPVWDVLEKGVTADGMSESVMGQNVEKKSGEGKRMKS